MTMTEVASMIPTASAVHSPTMTTTIDIPEVRTSEVEVVAVGIAGIDAEVPVAAVPVARAIEIRGCQVGVVLPVEQDVTQVEIALCPVNTVEVGLRVDAHQVVEVDLVGSLILLLGEVQFVCHLVGEEQSLLAGLLVTHCACRQSEGQQCCHGYQKSFHCRKFYLFITVVSFSRCKETNFP